MYSSDKTFAYFTLVTPPFYIKGDKKRMSYFKILLGNSEKDPVAEKVQTPFFGVPIT